VGGWVMNVSLLVVDDLGVDDLRVVDRAGA
jgi:hypothetical protein